MSFLLRRRKVPKTSEAPAAVEAVEGAESDKSARFKTRPPSFKNQKVFARVVLSSAVFIIVYFTSAKEKTTTLAGIKEVLSLREHKVDCSPESFALNSDADKSATCIPARCGRFASDNVISEAELYKLKEITANIFKKIFKDDDESSLAVDLYSEEFTKHETLSKSVGEMLKALQPKLIDTISQRFVTPHDSVALTSPSYISKVTNVTTEYSERLHQLHFDAEVSKSVHYTLVVFMGNFNKHFSGGKFIFVDTENHKKKNVVVEPKAGRTVGYTAGSENMHHLEKVTNGANYFITLSFTCSKLSPSSV